MKTLIFILIIISFVQYTILPFDLVLIILISRTMLKADKTNLFLAFGFGLLSSQLNLTPLGIESLVYLIIIELILILAKWRLSANFYLIVPLSFVFLFLHQLIISQVLRISFQFFPKIFLESLLSLPIFFLVKLWEERFIVGKEIKLKV